MISECCNAKAYFALGYAHGLYLDNDKYTGICSDCKEHSTFTKEESDG